MGTVIGTTVPLREEPAIVSLIPLNDTFLVLLLAASSLKHGSDPSLLPLADHLIDIPDVLFVLVEAHGVHLLLFLLLPTPITLSLNHFSLDVHNGLIRILVHGALRDRGSSTTLLRSRAVFHDLDRVVS